MIGQTVWHRAKKNHIGSAFGGHDCIGFGLLTARKGVFRSRCLILSPEFKHVLQYFKLLERLGHLL